MAEQGFTYYLRHDRFVASAASDQFRDEVGQRTDPMLQISETEIIVRRKAVDTIRNHDGNGLDRNELTGLFSRVGHSDVNSCHVVVVVVCILHGPL